MKLVGNKDGSTRGIELDGEGDVIVSFLGHTRHNRGLMIDSVHQSTFKNLQLVCLDMESARGVFFTLLFNAWFWLYKLGMKVERVDDVSTP